MHEIETKPTGASLPIRGTSPFAVVIRTHVLNEKFYDLLSLLSQSTAYDLFIAVDETAGPIDVPGYNTLPHSADSAAAFGLYTKHPNILWQCGDYAMYFCAAQIPRRTYYIFLDYDVDLVRRSPAFLEMLVARLSEPDAPAFVSPAFHEANLGWCWTEAAAKQFPIVYTTSTFAFIAASGPALSHLYERRKQEALECSSADDIVNCEAFCASALTQDGFRCASINQLIEGAVDFSTFHPPMPSLDVSQYLLNQYTIPDPNIEIVHPVYDLRNYLKKQFEKFRDIQQLPRFLDELDAISTTHAWESELISKYREMCYQAA